MDDVDTVDDMDTVDDVDGFAVILKTFLRGWETATKRETNVLPFDFEDLLIDWNLDDFLLDGVGD